jgi:hypothetical protein
MAEEGWDKSGSFGSGYLKTTVHSRGGSFIQSFALLDARIVFPAFTQLLESFRARPRRRLDARTSRFYYDLAFVHDVLSLTDTPFVPAASTGTRRKRMAAIIHAVRRRTR